MKNLTIYIKGKTSADAQAVLRWDATWKPQIKLQRQGTENHLPIRIVFLLLQSPNLSWAMGLKYNGRNTSQVQCFNRTPVFKPNLPVNPVWTELLLFKQHKCEGSSSSRSASQITHRLSVIAQVVSMPPVLAEQKQRGKNNSCRPHCDMAATHSPSTYTPSHIQRGANLKPAKVTARAKYQTWHLKGNQTLLHQFLLSAQIK